MTSLLPWPSWFLSGTSWHGVRRMLDRCRELIRGGALPGTLMVTGEPGLGREALAVELAATLICRDGGRADCGCSSCDRVRRGMHPDLVLLEVQADASEIKIEQTREIVDTILRLPYEGRRRVILVVATHTPPLNAYAAASLLKSLEEPPDHASWLLLAANPARVLPTIVSRSVLLRVPPPTRDEALALLASAHGVSPAAAAEHLDRCLDELSYALQTPPEEGGGVALVLAERVRALLTGDRLAALQLGALGRRIPSVLPLAAQALLTAAGTGTPELAEDVLTAAARLLTADRRRAMLHLDAESVMVGELAPLLAR
jgi:DNA polymerase III delta prime subunit